MAQDGTTAGGASYTLDNVTFPVGRNKLQSIFDAIRSTNKGNTAPDLVAGQFWIDDNTPSTTVWTLYFFDGTDSIQFATIDTINNTVNFIDSTFDLINDATPQLGGDLDLNSNDITGTGNINITGTATVSGDLTVDTNTLYVDSANNRVGVGTTSPVDDFEVTTSGLSAGDFVVDIGNKTVNVGRLSTTSGDNGKLFVRDRNNNGLTISGKTGADGTGLFRPDLNIMGISANGSEIARVTSSGVGIDTGGVASITELLTIGKKGGIQDNPDALSLGSSYSNTAGSPSRLKVKVYDGGGDNANGLGHSASLMNIVSGLSGHDMAFFTNGGGGSTERMRIASSGNVGIGTTSPTYPLSISSSYKGIQINDGTSTLTIESNTAGQWTNVVSGNNKWQVYTNGTNRLVIDGSGNVGIGTSSPQKMLHILNTATTGVTSTTPIHLRLEGNNSNYYDIGRDNQNTGFLSFYGNQSGANGYIFGGADGERMRIDSSGNVGIGTSSIDYTSAGRTVVHIEGSAGALLALEDTGARGYLYQAGNDLLIENDNATGSIIFGTNASTERMRIDSSGNLLVGMTSPSNLTTGFSARANSLNSFCRDTATADAAVLALNKKTGDGDILLIQKDGTTVGSIGASGGDIFMTEGNFGLRLYDNGTDKGIIPSTGTGAGSNNIVDLGGSGLGYKDLYLGGNIYLGGTGSANALDDYETGAWTPTVTGSTSGSYTGNNKGLYTKIGDLVAIEMDIAHIDSTDVSGDLTITGLPFSKISGYDMYINIVGFSINWDSTYTQLYGFFQTSSTQLELNWGRDSNPSIKVTNSELSSSASFLRAQFIYRTA